MIRSKYLALAAVALSFGALTACDSTSSSNAPTVSEFESANFTETTDTLKIGNYIDFYGKVTDDQGLKNWSLTVLNSAGAVVYTASVPTISGTSVSFDLQGKSTTNLRVSNDGSWGATGQYTVRLTVTNSQGNSINADQKIYAEGKGSATTTPLTNQGVVPLGAQSASAGSFLDVTNYTAYTSGANKPYATIDVVFGADAAGTASLLSPYAASTDGFPALAGSATTSAWPTLNKTIIVGPLTSALGTQEAVAAAIGSATTQKVAATNGLYALKLGSSGKYAALKLTVSGSGKTATADVTVYN
jgi:hypothetical protein